LDKFENDSIQYLQTTISQQQQQQQQQTQSNFTQFISFLSAHSVLACVETSISSGKRSIALAWCLCALNTLPIEGKLVIDAISLTLNLSQNPENQQLQSSSISSKKFKRFLGIYFAPKITVLMKIDGFQTLRDQFVSNCLLYFSSNFQWNDAFSFLKSISPSDQFKSLVEICSTHKTDSLSHLNDIFKENTWEKTLFHWLIGLNFIRTASIYFRNSFGISDEQNTTNNNNNNNQKGLILTCNDFQSRVQNRQTRIQQNASLNFSTIPSPNSLQQISNELDLIQSKFSNSFQFLNSNWKIQDWHWLKWVFADIKFIKAQWNEAEKYYNELFSLINNNNNNNNNNSTQQQQPQSFFVNPEDWFNLKSNSISNDLKQRLRTYWNSQLIYCGFLRLKWMEQGLEKIRYKCFELLNFIENNNHHQQSNNIGNSNNNTSKFQSNNSSNSSGNNNNNLIIEIDSKSFGFSFSLNTISWNELYCGLIWLLLMSDDISLSVSSQSPLLIPIGGIVFSQFEWPHFSSYFEKIYVANNDQLLLYSYLQKHANLIIPYVVRAQLLEELAFLCTTKLNSLQQQTQPTMIQEQQMATNLHGLLRQQLIESTKQRQTVNGALSNYIQSNLNFQK